MRCAGQAVFQGEGLVAGNDKPALLQQFLI